MSTPDETAPIGVQRQKRLPSPYLVYLGVYLLFYYAPALYLAYGESDLYYCDTNNYLTAASIFLLAYLAPALLFFRKKLLVKLNGPSATDARLYAKLYKFAIFFVGCAAIYVFFYAFFSGLNKLFLLGGDLDSSTFRFVGYDDSSIILQLPLELARRILLPLVCVYAAATYYYGRARRDGWLFVLTLVALSVGAILTLDRAPVLLAIVTLMFCLYIYVPTNLIFSVVHLPIFLVILPMAGSVVTMLQHNLTDFDFALIMEQASAVAVNRIWLDPLYMSCRDSFNLFDGWNNCLLLKYSRITSLFTGEYVGSYSDNSQYITPVGVVGDVWRNLGYIGMVIVPISLALCLIYIGTKMNNSRPVFAYLILFVSVEFSFYINYGNMFTYGAALLLIFILWMTGKRFSIYS